MRHGVLHRRVRTCVDAVFGSSCGADLLDQRRLGITQQLHESSVCERRLHGSVYAWGDALPGQQHTGLQLERPMGFDDSVRRIGVRERIVHGCVRAGDDPVLGQRRSNV
jgi:hypothetical protein